MSTSASCHAAQTDRRRLSPRLQSSGMRICSLLPSATEIVAELGLADSLVGVSDECRWPATSSASRSSARRGSIPQACRASEIDEAVRQAVQDGRSLYAVDAELIEELRPDLILTQDLCAVCAVSKGELESVCQVGADVLSLDPRTLGEVIESVRTVADRLGVACARRGDRRAHARGDRADGRLGSRACRAAVRSSRSGSTRRSAPGTGSRRWSRPPAART